jgi:hypothetical protein
MKVCDATKCYAVFKQAQMAELAAGVVQSSTKTLSVLLLISYINTCSPRELHGEDPLATLDESVAYGHSKLI